MKDILKDTLLMKNWNMAKSKYTSKLNLTIAILFSILAIIAAGSSNIVYIPLSPHKAIDLTIMAIVFASLIGGYRVAIPVAIVWSVTTWFKIDANYLTWPLWAGIVVRLFFTISLVWVYSKLRVKYQYSPLNVYRAIFISILIKNIVSIPFDIYYRGSDWIIGRSEQTIIEIGICLLAVSLLIKHLREIHILNGVRKNKKGDV